MFTTIRRLVSQFFNKSRKINNEPLNRVSLIVIILIDIFILINVFIGIDDISRWPLSPSETYPCYFEWSSYHEQNNQDKDYAIIYAIIGDSLSYQFNNSPSQKDLYQPSQKDLYQEAQTHHLGKVSPICLQYAEYKDRMNIPQNQQSIQAINTRQLQITKLEQANNQIRAQYDSTLLEKIAGQPRGQSINQVSAEKAKLQLDQNNREIYQRQKEISGFKKELLGNSEIVNFLTFLRNDAEFSRVKQGYQQASFWYPSIQLIFQAVFLLPLIFLTLLVHQFSQRQGYGLVSLISWHLLVIFLIPLIFKIFQFLQIGVIFEFVLEFISAILGRLLFLVSYVYILLIPLIGFGIIKFLQQIIFNPKLQAANRIQKSRCVKCAKKIRQNDAYCPHCSYYQYAECGNCHELTYKHLPHCKHCGTLQND